ncbi:glycosyltransferase family 4 protein [Photobacterium sp. R1]
MKLALLIDDYLPDSTRVGAKMFHELAQQLMREGHYVTVITPGFNQKEKLLMECYEGVTVWRYKSSPIKDVGKIKRAINESRLSYSAWSSIKGKVYSDSFDGVIYYSPSIFLGALVKRIKNICLCPSYLILRDLFPRWVIDAGMIREGSLIEKYFRLFERHSYNQANFIGLMSERNIEVFRQDYNHYNCHVLRNWASLIPVINYPDGYVSIRERLRLKDKVIFFYGGNIGHAQDMANLVRLARRMMIYPKAHFLFVGQGDEVELILKLSQEWKLNNFTYIPSVSQEEFKLILSEVDVGLFSLSSAHTAHNFPGKLLGYMVEALPILGSVNSGNDLKELVNEFKAGHVHVNGENELLFESAQKLYQCNQYRNKLGSNARNLLEKEFAVSSIAKDIINSLNKKS